jgi:alpha,alpha-trehalase
MCRKASLVLVAGCTVSVSSGAAAGTNSTSTFDAAAAARACTVYCEGPLLHAVQTCKLFADSKTFVDMPMRRDPERILKAFAELNEPTCKELAAFVKTNFDKTGADVVGANATDYMQDPPILAAIEQADMRNWTEGIHKLWPTLVRAAVPDVAMHPQRHSLLPRAHHVVVPGGRFRESYYWDSYWIVKGLLVSSMPDTAKGVVLNLLDDVDSIGHVPNGGRIYYTERSQPPLLSSMVTAVLACKDLQGADEFLQRALPTLEKEYEYWMTKHAVILQGYTLNRYWADTATARPRPESYREDLLTANKSLDKYAEITAGAESGWDFSSRWWPAPANTTSNTTTANTTAAAAAAETIDEFGLADLQVRSILPVDLNSYMYKFETHLAEMCATAGRSNDSTKYTTAATARANAIGTLMWDNSTDLWRDILLIEESLMVTNNTVYNANDTSMWSQSSIISAACYIPLWCGSEFHKHTTSTDAVLKSIKKSGLIGVGGVMTTITNSGEQWDKPNVWPPLQWIVVEGIRQLGGSAATAYSRKLALAYLDSVHKAWLATGFMHEKHNGLKVGSGGGGGEYVPQVGFGWTNGVVLDWLQRYYSNNTMTMN